MGMLSCTFALSDLHPDDAGLVNGVSPLFQLVAEDVVRLPFLFLLKGPCGLDIFLDFLVSLVRMGQHEGHGTLANAAVRSYEKRAGKPGVLTPG